MPVYETDELYKKLYHEMTAVANENYKLLCETLDKLNVLEAKLGLSKTTYSEEF